MLSIIQHLIRTSSNSWNGLRLAFCTEKAIRIEVGFFVILAPLSFILGKTRLESAVLLASLILVFITELLNTAIEKVIDRIGPEYHELSKFAKDTAGAAVGLSLFLVIFIWVFLIL